MAMIRRSGAGEPPITPRARTGRSARSNLLRGIFNVEVESSGGPFTLDRGYTQIYNDDDPYANTNASSYRGIFDLSDLDRSTYIQTTGQSGNVFSGHYNDFAGLWANVQSIEIPAGDVADPVGVWSLSPAQ
jgi:penicillin amidase